MEGHICDDNNLQQKQPVSSGSVRSSPCAHVWNSDTSDFVARQFSPNEPPGPKNIPATINEESSPGDLLSLCWDDVMWQLLTNETNKMQHKGVADVQMLIQLSDWPTMDYMRLKEHQVQQPTTDVLFVKRYIEELSYPIKMQVTKTCQKGQRQFSGATIAAFTCVLVNQNWTAGITGIQSHVLEINMDLKVACVHILHIFTTMCIYLFI